MTAVFSTSSSIASVALFESGKLLASRRLEAPRAASGACLGMLDELLASSKKDLAQISLYVSDTGPGSFTGVKVGVMLAKTLAFAKGAKVGGIQSFDLVDPDSTVVLASRKGEWFVREPGTPGYRTQDARPEEAAIPLAERAGPVLPHVCELQPEELLPTYLAEPSISSPKTPYREA